MGVKCGDFEQSYTVIFTTKRSSQLPLRRYYKMFMKKHQNNFKWYFGNKIFQMNLRVSGTYKANK